MFFFCILVFLNNNILNDRYLSEVQYLLKVDKKPMFRNRYNRIPHPVLNTKQERDTYNSDGATIKTAQVKSPGDISFPTDSPSHKAILNKLNSKSKTKKKSGRTLTTRINHNRSIALKRSVINYWGA